MKKQKLSIIIVSLLALTCLISLFPTGLAWNDVLVTYQNTYDANTDALWAVDPGAANEASAITQSFTVTNQAWLNGIQIDLKRTGSLAFTVNVSVYQVSGATSLPDSEGSVLLETSSTTVASSTISTSVWTLCFFQFSGNTWLNSSKTYELKAYIASATGAFNYPDNSLSFRKHTADAYAGREGYWYNGAYALLGATDDIEFYVYGNSQAQPTASPAPTASPIPTTDPSGGIWATLAPYGNIMLPLFIILIVAIICGRFGGVWGFFAGLNISAILVYVVMGATYFPLWGMVMLAVVDGMLLFGKISGRV